MDGARLMNSDCSHILASEFGMRRKKRPKHRATDEPLSIEMQPSEMAKYVDVHQAAKLLDASISHVYGLGRGGALTRFLIRALLPARTAAAAMTPHPWQLAEQRRLAELSGWKSVSPIKLELKRTAQPKPQPRARLSFLREEVIALKADLERKGWETVARRTRVRVLGRDVSWPRVRKIRQIRARRPRANVVRRPAHQASVQDPAIASTTKLLSWAVPPPLID